VTELRPETPKGSSSTSNIGHANAFPEREYIHLNVGTTLSEQIADHIFFSIAELETYRLRRCQFENPSYGPPIQSASSPLSNAGNKR
jgi:hypothetical protein